MSRRPVQRRGMRRLIGADAVGAGTGAGISTTVGRTVRERAARAAAQTAASAAGPSGRRDWDPDDPTGGTGTGRVEIVRLTTQSLVTLQLEAVLQVDSGSVDAWGLRAGGISEQGLGTGLVAWSGVHPALSLSGRAIIAPLWSADVVVATTDPGAVWRLEWTLTWW